MSTSPTASNREPENTPGQDRLLRSGDEVRWITDPNSHGVLVEHPARLGPDWWTVQWDRLDGERVRFTGFQPESGLIRL